MIGSNITDLIKENEELHAMLRFFENQNDEYEARIHELERMIINFMKG